MRTPWSGAPRIEVFTFGTRLTRVTRALRLKRREQALGAAAHLVSDWDGGTRIGDALQAFLAVPRFGGYARGAPVLIVSDGLERGDLAAMRDAVAKLSRRAWRVSWLTPLAVGKNFKPQTEALIAISRFVDEMVDGGSTPAIVAHVLRPRATEGRVTRSSTAIITSGGRPICPGWSARCSRASSGPTSRSAATIRSGNISDISSTGVVKSVYVQTNWPRERFEDEAAWVQRTAEATGWPHAIVAYADFSVDDVRPQFDRLARYPLVRGVRMQLHWHENPLYRFAARADLATDPTVQRNVAQLADYGWSFDLQVFAPQMPGGADLAEACPESDVRPAARRDAGGSLARGPRRMARRHGAAGGVPECRLQALGPRHVPASQRPRAYRRSRARDGRDIRRGSLPVRLEFPDRKAVDALWRARRRLSQGRGSAAAEQRDAILHDTAMRVYRIGG